jgi:aspartyl-tRNA(Asn)/glutamyl-tRNA(Gln) amidotransferase subunit C
MSSGRLPISHVAKLARLELTPEEAALFEAQLDPILAMIDKLKEVDLGSDPGGPLPPDGLPPLRDDAPHPGLATQAALSNAPAQARDQFSVPRVIDAE